MPEPQETTNHSEQDQTSPWGIPSDSAFFSSRSHLLIWPLAITFLALDLWSKSYVFATLEPGEVPTYLGGLISFRRSLNPGALFGIGKGMAPLFITASMVALLFVLYLFACSSRRHRLLHFGLAMILAGALGNLYDRCMVMGDVVEYFPSANSERAQIHVFNVIEDRDADMINLKEWGVGDLSIIVPKERIVTIQTKGVVRDFIKIERIGDVDIWPWVFNIADIFLSVGVGILLLQFWRDRKLLKASPQADETATE